MIDVDCKTARESLVRMLTESGAKFEIVPLLARTDRSASEWDKSAVHFQYVLTIGRTTRTGEFSAGSAHPDRWIDENPSMLVRQAVRRDGPKWRRLAINAGLLEAERAKFRPEAVDIFGSLLSDADGDLSSFEEWCGNLGYDTDSRKALAAFESCQKTAAALRAMLGDRFDEACELARQL